MKPVLVRFTSELFPIPFPKGVSTPASCYPASCPRPMVAKLQIGPNLANRGIRARLVSLARVGWGNGVCTTHWARRALGTQCRVWCLSRWLPRARAPKGIGRTARRSRFHPVPWDHHWVSAAASTPIPCTAVNPDTRKWGSSQRDQVTTREDLDVHPPRPCSCVMARWGAAVTCAIRTEWRQSRRPPIRVAGVCQWRQKAFHRRPSDRCHPSIAPHT